MTAKAATRPGSSRRHLPLLLVLPALAVVLTSIAVAPASAKAKAKPGQVVNVAVTPGDGQATLTWDAVPDADPVTYEVLTSGPGSACETTATTCTVTGLTNGVKVGFQVRAGTAAGWGQRSDRVTTTPLPVPGQPTAVTAAPYVGSATIGWSAPAPNGGPEVTSYLATASPGGLTCAATAPTTSCEITGLTEGTYTFTVQAASSIGLGPSSLPSAPTATLASPCSSAIYGPYLDVTGVHPFCSAIAWYRDNGYPSSYTDGNFHPTEAFDRGTLAAALYRLAEIDDDVAPATPRFSDVPTSHPFYTEISWVAEHGISGGFADGTFRPSSPVSRQAFAAYLFRMVYASGSIAPPFEPPFDSPPFSDVPPSSPFFREITWITASDIMTGYADGTFRPTEDISRQAAAVYVLRIADSSLQDHIVANFHPDGATERGMLAAALYRLAEVDDYVAPATPRFSDVPTSHPFYTEISWVAEHGISGGFADGTFRPSSPVSRQAFAAYLFRMVYASGSIAPPFEPPFDSPPFSDVPPSSPFFREITWIAASAILSGYPDGTFLPTAALSWAELSVSLQAAADSPQHAYILANY